MRNQAYVTKQKVEKFPLWKGRSSLLGKLDIELTERCNNNCVHCCINLPADDADAKKRELSTGEVKGILKEAASLDCMTVGFTGGEPLLREDFEELYVFARKSGLRIILFTNATLITSRLAELLSRIPPLEKIEVTVYGMKKSSYEAVTRTPGSFEDAWRGINLLLKNKIPFVVKGALLPANEGEIDKFEAWQATLPWIEKPPAYSMFFYLRCRRDDPEKNESIKKLRFTPADGLKLLARRKNDYFREMRNFCAKFTAPPGDKLFSCGAGRGSSCVDAYGVFQLCLMLRHPDTVYNLGKGSLKDALTNFFPKVRQLKTTNPDYLSRCAKCFLKGLCEQCPAQSWTEHGTLDTPVEYHCEVAHTQARYLGLIGEDEMAWQVKDWRGRIDGFSARGL